MGLLVLFLLFTGAWLILSRQSPYHRDKLDFVGVVLILVGLTIASVLYSG